ncbi:protein FAM217B, partial [Echinops telfairi]|uniref:Protein FAM217B n=1 Tax=Echinops telfairi TaxID=9371 RepID=A0ABM1VLX1_ECHTE
SVASISGSEEAFPNISGRKQPLPFLSPSASSLSKSIPSTAEKTTHQSLDEDQPCVLFKKGNRLNDSHQTSSRLTAEPAWTTVQPGKNPSGKRPSKSRSPRISSQQQSRPIGALTQADATGRASVHEGRRPEWSPPDPGRPGTAGASLFLAFQSMKLLSEDTDEDSASDLSDSERIPIPPSPLTPPDLRLRAEEFNPAYFRPYPEPSHAKPDYLYPDFLPPPFDSWDLQEMAVMLNSEGKADTVPRAAGLLGRYIDRLVQLEWLQTQTVQTERARVGGKGRPPTAPGTFWPPKSPGRSRLVAAALPKPLPPQDRPLRPWLSRKKDWHQEDPRASCTAFQTGLRAPDFPAGSRLASKKQAQEGRPEERRKKPVKSSKLQCLDLACGDSGAKLHANGNLRTPRASAAIIDPGGPCKAPRTQAHVALKKKGNASHGSHSSVSGEKKLKASGMKRRFK